jgi:hypothetical protein
MYKKSLPILIILIMTLVSACGPAPEPTLSADDLANTAVANAWTMLTLTQAAIPTATATFPPTATFTPQPTFTFPAPLPTLELLSSNATATSSTNPCYDPPPAKPKGKMVQIKLVNNSKGLVDLSLGMENPNDEGECATYYFPLGRYDQQVVSVFAACYWGYAYIKDPDSNAETAGPLCLFDTTKTVPVSIGAEVIALQ